MRFYDRQIELSQLHRLQESVFQNEIDLVAINQPRKLMILAEIKLNKKNIRKERLQAKSAQLYKLYPDYKIEYRFLGLEDPADYI